MKEFEIVIPPPETVLWRYLDLSKLLSLLEEGAIHFSRADKFEDLYEGHWSSPTNAEILRLADGSGTAERIARQPIELRDKMFINCWHMSDTESAGMWEKYLRGPEGVAIRTTFGKLKRQFSRHPLHIEYGRVEYIDYVSDEMDHRRVFNPYFHKRKMYDYEKEFRVAIFNQPSGTHHIKVGNDAPVYAVSVTPVELIDSIVVSPASGPWLRPLLTRVLKERYELDVPLLDSTVDKGPLGA